MNLREAGKLPARMNSKGNPITIGGSQIAALLGISPFENATPYSTWAYLMEKSPGIASTEAMDIGVDIEDFIAKLYEKRTGRIAIEQAKLYGIQWGGSFDFQPDKFDFQWASASPDRILSPELDGEEWQGLEIKNCSEYSGDDWDDNEVPAYYVTQGRWYMFITGYHSWHFAALIGGNRLEVRTIHRDFDWEDEIVCTLADWYKKHIVDGVEPEKTPNEYRGFAKGKVRADAWKEEAATGSVVDTLLNDIKETSIQFKSIEKSLEDLKDQAIRMSEGTTGLLSIDGRNYMKWIATKDGTKLDVEELIKEVPADVVARHTKFKMGNIYPKFTFKK